MPKPLLLLDGDSFAHRAYHALPKILRRRGDRGAGAILGFANFLLMRVGIISDTHGLMRPEALTALEGSDLIVHAGDIGAPQVLEELRAVAPVFAVRGNVDVQPWAMALPDTLVVVAGAHRLYVLHDLSQLAIDPADRGFAAVIFGHSHEASVEWQQGVLYINPGSAGPRRFRLPVCMARLEITAERLRPGIVLLDGA